jgi:TctA family transporter
LLSDLPESAFWRMPAQTSEPTHAHPSSKRTNAFKAAAGSAFLMAAVYEALSVWIKGSRLDFLVWLLPVVGAAIGYTLSLASENTATRQHKGPGAQR